jgi:2-C-methyl-D-erythritol 4-phosphate cytidylyltransferase
MRRVAILLAAGKGERMQNGSQDKILHPLCGRPVFAYSVSAFLRSGLISDWVVVYRDENQKSALREVLQTLLPKDLVTFVPGGKERMESVWFGLQAVAPAPETDFVFIHDCARPLLRVENIRRLAEMAETMGAAVLVHRVHDTIRRVSGNTFEDVDRDGLLAMETPQVFEYKGILEAYRRVIEERLHVTDDVGAWLRTGKGIGVVENEWPNVKLTTPKDILLLESLIREGFYE